MAPLKVTAETLFYFSFFSTPHKSLGYSGRAWCLSLCTKNIKCILCVLHRIIARVITAGCSLIDTTPACQKLQGEQALKGVEEGSHLVLRGDN